MFISLVLKDERKNVKDKSRETVREEGNETGLVQTREKLQQ